MTATAALASVSQGLAPVPPASVTPPRPVSVTPVARTDDWAVDRQNEMLARARGATSADIIFLGDSITQGWESAGNRAWRESIAPLGTALNLGVSGDRTEHVLWRIQEAPLKPLNPKVIVLMIGTNNIRHGSSSPVDTALGVRTVVDILAEQCREATIVLLGIFPSGHLMNTTRADVCQINQSLQSFATRHPTKRVQFHDIGYRFVEPDGTIKPAIMPDEVHLSPDGYRIWADAVVPVIRSNLETAPAAESTKQ